MEFLNLKNYFCSDERMHARAVTISHCQESLWTRILNILYTKRELLSTFHILMRKIHFTVCPTVNLVHVLSPENPSDSRIKPTKGKCVT